MTYHLDLNFQRIMTAEYIFLQGMILFGARTKNQKSFQIESQTVPKMFPVGKMIARTQGTQRGFCGHEKLFFPHILSVGFLFLETTPRENTPTLSHHIIPHHNSSHHITSHHNNRISSHHITSCHVTPRRTTSHHIIIIIIIIIRNCLFIAWAYINHLRGGGGEGGGDKGALLLIWPCWAVLRARDLYRRVGHQVSNLFAGVDDFAYGLGLDLKEIWVFCHQTFPRKN